MDFAWRKRYMSCSMSWIDPSANPRSKLTRLIQWELTMRANHESNLSITTKSIAYLWHSNTPQPKPTFLSFIHDWKVHGLNLILRDFQLCQMNYSLSGNSFLKNWKSKKCEKRLILIWQETYLMITFGNLFTPLCSSAFHLFKMVKNAIF